MAVYLQQSVTGIQPTVAEVSRPKTPADPMDPRDATLQTFFPITDASEEQRVEQIRRQYHRARLSRVMSSESSLSKLPLTPGSPAGRPPTASSPAASAAAPRAERRPPSLRRRLVAGLVYFVALVCRPFLQRFKWVARWTPDLYWAATAYAPALQKRVVPSATDRESIRRGVLGDKHVRQAGAKLVREQLLRRVNGILDNMMGAMSMLCIRLWAWFFVKLFRRLYPFGVHVRDEEVQRLREYIAAHPGPTLIVPTHKSHLDYMVVSYVCFKYQLPLPHIVAGENLRIPIVGRILRWAGAVFIRRSFGNDPLYKAVFAAYVYQLLKRGFAMECFIEGARSRSGKVLPPKVGFLRVVVDAVAERVVDDVSIIPMALSYDLIIEKENHIFELTGGVKQSERLWSFIVYALRLAFAILRGRLCLGSVDVGIAEPISVAAAIDEHARKCEARAAAPPRPRLRRLSTSGSLHGDATLDADEDEESLRPDSPLLMGASRPLSTFTSRSASPITERSCSVLADSFIQLPEGTRGDVACALGYRILHSCNKASIVLPAALVGTVLLTQNQRGIEFDDLVARVRWLRQELIDRGGSVEQRSDMTIREGIIKVVDRVLGGRSGLVKRHKIHTVMLELYSPSERMELSLLRNQIIHYFVPESIIALAMYACERSSEANNAAIQTADLMAGARELSQLLKLEFIYKPSPSLKENFDETLMMLVRREVLTTVGEGCVAVNSNYDGALGEHGSRDESAKGVIMYLFLCSLLWPFIDSYWLTCLGLYRLLPDRIAVVDALLEHVQRIGEKLYFEGQLDLYESISRETITNALTLLAEWKVVRITNAKQASGNDGRRSLMRVVQLGDQYNNAEALDGLVNKLGRYKKRSRAYSSRRYRGRRCNDVQDAIQIVKMMADDM